MTYPTSGITIDNANLVKKDYNDGKTYGGRAALKIDLNDSWSITPSVIAQESKLNGSYGYRVGTGLRHHAFQSGNLEGSLVAGGAYGRRQDQQFRSGLRRRLPQA